MDYRDMKELRHSDDVLAHKNGFKYIKKYWQNGKWQYVYDTKEGHDNRIRGMSAEVSGKQRLAAVNNQRYVDAVTEYSDRIKTNADKYNAASKAAFDAKKEAEKITLSKKTRDERKNNYEKATQHLDAVKNNNAVTEAIAKEKTNAAEKARYKSASDYSQARLNYYMTPKKSTSKTSNATKTVASVAKTTISSLKTTASKTVEKGKAVIGNLLNKLKK